MPTPDEGRKGRLEYLRSKQDPYALIACRTGEVFERRDGLRWEWPAYQIDREENDSITIKGVPAHCDTDRYEAQP